MKTLEQLAQEFREKCEEGRENPQLLGLHSYEDLIAGNIENGNLQFARIHADLLTGFYITDNPYRPSEDKAMADIRSKKPELYEGMDAARKAYHIGLVAQEIVEVIDRR